MADGRHYNLSLILVENYSETGENIRAAKKQNFKKTVCSYIYLQF